MSIKRPPVLDRKPVYEGDRMYRGDGEKQMFLCCRCDRLATHRAQAHISDGRRLTVLDRWYCEMHLNDAIKYDDIRRARALPEYKRFLSRLHKWQAQQEAGHQDVLL